MINFKSWLRGVIGAKDIYHIQGSEIKIVTDLKRGEYADITVSCEPIPAGSKVNIAGQEYLVVGTALQIVRSQ